MQKDGVYCLYLRRETPYGHPYENGNEGYTINLKQLKIIESFLKKEGFKVNTIKGAKKTDKEIEFLNKCKYYQDIADGNYPSGISNKPIVGSFNEEDNILKNL